MDYVGLLVSQIEAARAALGKSARGVVRTTPKSRSVLIDYWAAEINKAFDEGIDGFGNERVLTNTLSRLRAVPAPSDAEFWDALQEAAIALNVEQTAPTQWELFRDAFNEVIHERQQQWRSATKPTNVGKAVAGLGALALVGYGLTRVLRPKKRPNTSEQR